MVCKLHLNLVQIAESVVQNWLLSRSLTLC
jgi:hypothetical protein